MRGLKRLRVHSATGSEESDSEDDVAQVTHERDCVYFYASVSKRTLLKLLVSLERATEWALQHCTDSRECTVYLYIFSNGGDAWAGLSAMDHIRNNKVPVTTVIDGYVASAATFLVLGGEYRAAMRHSTMMIHQLSTGFWGRYADLVDEYENSTSLMQTIQTVYEENTLLTPKKIDRLLRAEKNLTSAKTLEMGFVHELW